MNISNGALHFLHKRKQKIGSLSLANTPNTSGKNCRLAASTLVIDFKKPWNFLHNLSASHCKGEADSSTRQLWWSLLNKVRTFYEKFYRKV